MSVALICPWFSISGLKAKGFVIPLKCIGVSAQACKSVCLSVICKIPIFRIHGESGIKRNDSFLILGETIECNPFLIPCFRIIRAELYGLFEGTLGFGISSQFIQRYPLTRPGHSHPWFEGDSLIIIADGFFVFSFINKIITRNGEGAGRFRDCR